VDIIERNQSILQSIEQVKCNGLKSLQGIPFIPKVIFKDCNKRTDISALQSQRFVEIQSCPDIISFATLKWVPRVNIQDCPQFTNGRDVENVHHLTIGSFHFKDATMLGNVYHLDLTWCKVDSLSGLENVVILELWDIIGSLSAFQNGKNQKIIVKDNLNLRHYLLSALQSTLPDGYELIVELCKRITEEYSRPRFVENWREPSDC
jgi:hypothetical protein